VESVAGDASDHSVWFVHDIDALVSIRTPNTRDASSQEQVRAIYQAREGALVPLEPDRCQSVNSELSC
jgi:hypothetical protein